MKGTEAKNGSKWEIKKVQVAKCKSKEEEEIRAEILLKGISEEIMKVGKNVEELRDEMKGEIGELRKELNEVKEKIKEMKEEIKKKDEDLEKEGKGLGE